MVYEMYTHILMFILIFGMGSGSDDCIQNPFNTRPHYVCLLL